MNDDIKEILQALKESYNETMPKQEFERSLKYIEEHITNLQQENKRLKADNQDLKFEISVWKKLTDRINETNKYLNVKIKKAIEYIENAQERDGDKESCSLHVPTLKSILENRSDK